MVSTAGCKIESSHRLFNWKCTASSVRATTTRRKKVSEYAVVVWKHIYCHPGGTRGITINCLRVLLLHTGRIYYNRGFFSFFLRVCVLLFNSLPLSKVLLWNLQAVESASWTIQRLKQVALLNKIRSELHSWFRGYRAAPIWTLTRAASLLSLSQVNEETFYLPCSLFLLSVRQSPYTLFINRRGLSDLFAGMLGQISCQSRGRGSHAKA